MKNNEVNRTQWAVGDTLVSQSTNTEVVILEVQYDHIINKATKYYFEITKTSRRNRMGRKYWVVEFNLTHWILKAKGHLEVKCLPQTENIVSPILTVYEAYVFEHESKKPKYQGQALAWHKDGRCPECGELGPYRLSQAVCSKHGPY